MPPKLNKVSNSGLLQPRLELVAKATECTMGDYRKITRSLHAKEQQDLFTTELNFDFTVAADGAGTYSSNFSNGASSSPDWASYAAIFDEYRVIALKVVYTPVLYVGGSTATQFQPIATVIDYDDGNVPATMSGMSEFSSFKEHAPLKPWSVVALAQSVSDLQFIDTASPAATFNIHALSLGNTASVNLGRLKVQYLTQFRGKGV